MSVKIGTEHDHILMISDLPEEVLLKIFAYVSHFDIFLNIRNVCQEWKLLGESASLWKSVDLQIEMKLQKIEEQDEFLPLLKHWFEVISCHISYLNVEIECDRFIGLLQTDKTFSFPTVTTLCMTIDNTVELQTVKDIIESNFPNLQNLHLNVDRITHEDFMDNLSFMSFIRNMNCVGFSFSIDRLPLIDMTTFLEYLPNLICLRSYILTDDSIKTVLKNCKRLEKLDLLGCFHIKCEAFEAMPIQHVLNSLNISCTYLEDACLKIITQNTPNLKNLYLYECIYITDIGFSHVGDNCANMEVLEVNKSSYSRGRNITNVGLDAVARGCKNLKVLVAKFCQGITDQGVQSVAEHCSNILTLKLSGCSGITDKALEYLGSRCLLLNHVEFDECVQVTCKGVNTLIGNCIWLHTVKFDSCNLINQLNFTPFMQILNTNVLSKPKKCERDTRIVMICETQDEIDKINNFSHYGDKMRPIIDDNRVTDLCDISTSTEVLGAINDKTNARVSTDMTDVLNTVSVLADELCTRKTNMGDADASRTSEIATTPENAFVVKPDAKNASPVSGIRIHFNSIHHSHLRKLHLKFCRNITNDSVKQIADYCPDLRKLYVTGTYLITDSSIQYLLRKCMQLRVLDISGGSTLGTSGFTDDILVSSAHDGKALEKLMIQKNYNITKTGIRELLWTSQNLKELSFHVLPAKGKQNSNYKLSLDECTNLVQEFGAHRASLDYLTNPSGLTVVKIIIMNNFNIHKS